MKPLQLISPLFVYTVTEQLSEYAVPSTEATVIVAIPSRTPNTWIFPSMMRGTATDGLLEETTRSTFSGFVVALIHNI